MTQTIVCAFLTYHDASCPRRREFVWAAKNCREVGRGNYRGWDGREAALDVSRLRSDRVRAYLSGAILVGVPPSGSGVDTAGDEKWSGRDLARMFAREYGATAMDLLERHTAVPKSSAGGSRTVLRHTRSIRTTGAVPARPIVLVDDVVASGSTMCGCAHVLRRVDPGAVIKGLAVGYRPGRGELGLRDFAARQYEWTRLDRRPRNWLLPTSPFDER